VFPFFDMRLVEYVLRTPPVPWRRDKRLLREAMRGRLPEEVRLRPKTPLYVPHGRPADDHPLRRLGRQPGTRRWRRELIAAAPLSPYVDVQRALSAVDALPPTAAGLLALENLFAFAHWLTHEI
jgi:asparagine synthase (glutamine-hydrolysing)